MQDTTQHQEASSTEDSGGDFLSRLDQVIGEAFEEKPKKEESVIEDKVVETKATEESKVQDEDGLETPEMTEAVKKMSMKSAEAFNKIKANANAKLAEYKQKLADLESKVQSTANDARIEELNAAIAQKESVLAETSKKLAFYDVTETKEYQDAVTKPTQIIKAKITELAQAYDLKSSDIVKAVTEKDPKVQRELIRDIVRDMDDFDKPALYEITKDFSSIMATEDMLRENAVAAWEEIQANRGKEKEESKVKMTQERKQLGEQVWAKLSEKVPVLKDLNADTLKATFDATDFDSMPLVNKVGAIASAVTFAPVLQKLMSEAKVKDTKIAELEASLKKYINTSPGAGSGVTADVSAKLDDGLDFLSAMEKRLAGA